MEKTVGLEEEDAKKVKEQRQIKRSGKGKDGVQQKEE